MKNKGGILKSVSGPFIHEGGQPETIIGNVIPKHIEIPRIYFGSNPLGTKKGDKITFVMGEIEGNYIVTKVDIDGTVHVEPSDTK